MKYECLKNDMLMVRQAVSLYLDAESKPSFAGACVLEKIHGALADPVRPTQVARFSLNTRWAFYAAAMVCALFISLPVFWTLLSGPAQRELTVNINNVRGTIYIASGERTITVKNRQESIAVSRGARISTSSEGTALFQMDGSIVRMGRKSSLVLKKAQVNIDTGAKTVEMEVENGVAGFRALGIGESGSFLVLAGGYTHEFKDSRLRYIVDRLNTETYIAVLGNDSEIKGDRGNIRLKNTKDKEYISFSRMDPEFIKKCAGLYADIFLELNTGKRIN